MMALERKYKKCLGMGYSKLIIIIMGSCGVVVIVVVNCVNYVKDAAVNASQLVIFLSIYQTPLLFQSEDDDSSWATLKNMILYLHCKKKKKKNTEECCPLRLMEEFILGLPLQD